MNIYLDMRTVLEEMDTKASTNLVQPFFKSACAEMKRDKSVFFPLEMGCATE